MQQEMQINNSIVERFSTLNKKERLAHAYLFIGPSNIGKGETALAIAKLINCEQSGVKEYCDICSACIKINSGNHPDVMIIDLEYGEAIKIEQIRELLNQSKLRPFLAEKKVFIINNIENMTLEAANAFLKTLEEPTASSLLLLTTSVPEKNLDTVKSRCHAIYFQSVSSNDLVKQLRENYHMEEKESHFIAYFSQGCLGMAKKLNANQFVNKKNELINTFILNRPEEVTIKKIIAEREETKEFLDVLSSWMRDCLLAKVGVEDERLIHLDRISDLKQFVARHTFEELNALNQSIIKMHQLLADHLNIKLPLLIIGEQLWEK